MKHMNSRRILAMLLALCMMVGMLSMTAFADEGTETSGESSGEETTGPVTTGEQLVAAFANANDGDTITLGANVEVNAPINVEKSITLDLGEYTANFTGDSVISAQFAFMVGATGSVATFTIKGTTGKVTSDYGVVSVRSDGSAFELQGGTLVSNKGHTVENYSFGANKTITISGGAIESKGGNGALHAGENSKLIVTGGKITALNGYAAIYASTGTEVSLKNVEINTTGMSNAVLFATNTAKAALENVTVVSDKKILNASGNASIEVKSGSYKNTSASIFDFNTKNTVTTSGDATISISGGTFVNNDNALSVDAKYLASGCTIDETTGEVKASYVAYIGDQGYTTLEAAIKAANEGDTINLTAGEFTTAGEFRSTKSLTFVGAGANQTTWTIGDLNTHVNGEANGDYSFENAENITFKNMTLKSDTDNYRGFIRIKNSVVENCTIDGKTAYWGYASATFKNVLFNAPTGDYAIWVYSSPKVAFEECTFNTSGKAIHVYNEAAGELNTTIALKDCTVNQSESDKAFVNIKYNQVPTTLKLYGNNKVLDSEGKNVTGTVGLYQFSLHNNAAKSDELADSYVYEVTVDEQGGETSKQLATTAKATGVAKITRDGTDFTYATLAEAFAAAKDGDTITLLSDCFGNGIKVEANQFATGLTVDFGGYTYTFNGTPVGSTGSETQAAHFESGNKITLKNGKFDAAASSDVRILVQNYAELTLSKMELDGTNVAQNGTNLFTLSCNNGNVVIEDSTIKAPATATGVNHFVYAIDICGFANYAGTSVTVKTTENGTSLIDGNIRFFTERANPVHQLSLDLQGGTVNGTLSLGGLSTNDEAKLSVTKAASVVVTAPSGYKWDETGTELVKDETADDYVASVDNKKYQSLEEAIDAVGKDGTVYLNKDIKTENGIFIHDKEHFLLNLGEHTITGTKAGTVAFKVQNADVKLKANSKGGIDGGSGGSNVAVCALDGANITIVSGNYTVGADANGEGNSTIYVNGNGNITIFGGTFSTAAAYNGKYYVLNVNNQTKGTITVRGNGAKFENFNPLNGDDNLGGNFCASSCGVEMTSSGSNGEKIYTSKLGLYQVLNKDGEPIKVYKTTEKDALLTAIDKGQTVMLLANATANITIPAGKDFTLDLNGKTLSGGKNNGNATIKNYGTVVIDDSSKEKAGRIIREDVGNETGTTYYVIHNLGTMTIKNGTIYNNSGYKKANPSGSMEGSSLICNSNDDAHPATLNIEGGTLEQANFIAIKNGSSGTLVMTGGTVKSGHSAIQNWHDATITGGKVIGQLWTDSYIDEFSTGKTVFGGEAKFEGEIVMDITGNIKPTLEIKGGELDVTSWRVTNGAANAGARPEVSGGTFTREVPAGYCKDGFVPATLPGGKYGVEPAKGDVKLIGADGNVRYGSIADAIENETIQLYKDITVDGVYLRTGRTLDLNGWTLTTEYVYAPGADVIDSKDGVGKLVVTNKDNVTVKMSASYLPLYDGTGYRIFKYTFTFLDPELDSTKSKITLRMTLAFENLDAYNVLTASSQHGIDMGFRVAWPNDNNSDQSWQLRMTPEGVTDVYTKAKTKVGLEGCKTGKVKLVITGVNLLSSDVLYSLSELVSANWTNGMTIVSDKATTTIK